MLVTGLPIRRWLAKAAACTSRRQTRSLAGVPGCGVSYRGSLGRGVTPGNAACRREGEGRELALAYGAPSAPSSSRQVPHGASVTPAHFYSGGIQAHQHGLIRGHTGAPRPRAAGPKAKLFAAGLIQDPHRPLPKVRTLDVDIGGWVIVSCALSLAPAPNYTAPRKVRPAKTFPDTAKRLPGRRSGPLFRTDSPDI